MHSLCRGLALAGMLMVGAAFAAEPPVPAQPVQPGAPAAIETTHEMTAEVKVMGTDGKTKLQTLCLDGAGRVLALVAQPRTFSAPADGASGEVHVFADGKPVKNWKVDFHAHAINVGPDGTIFVAGDGKLAKFDKDGKPVGGVVEMPHVAELFKNDGELKKKAEEQLKRNQETMKKSYEQNRKRVEELIAKIEEKKEEDRTPVEVKQLEQYKNTLKLYDNAEKNLANQTVDSVMKQMTGRVRVVNGIAISEKDVFVVGGDITGVGFAVWRFDHEFKNSTKVLENLSGCCGQMDIQVSGSSLLVAENTKHSFGVYDRDGKPVGRFGKKIQPGKADPECFGGCCNPMNLRCCSANGDIFTAESEGIVKRFSAKGDYLDTAAVVKLTGGCKNVAVAASPDGKTVFLCDQPGSRFVELTRKTAEKDKK